MTAPDRFAGLMAFVEWLETAIATRTVDRARYESCVAACAEDGVPPLVLQALRLGTLGRLATMTMPDGSDGVALVSDIADVMGIELAAVAADGATSVPGPLLRGVVPASLTPVTPPTALVLKRGEKVLFVAAGNLAQQTPSGATRHSEGTFTLTDRRAVFLGQKRGFNLGLNVLTQFESHDDRLVIGDARGAISRVFWQEPVDPGRLRQIYSTIIVAHIGDG